MPEGDTIFRTAYVLRQILLGERITDARARPGGAHLDRVVGGSVAAVTSRGKHVLIEFDLGLTLHTHLGMQGSWHRYRPGERWRQRRDAAVAVLETPNTVAVCFDAPTVELIETKALPMHPVLARLGPDLLAPEPDVAAAAQRLLAPERRNLTIAEALLDQSAVAGIGNVYRSEVLFLAGLDPFRRTDTLPVENLEPLLRRAAALLRANTDGGARTTRPGAGSVARSDRLQVYGRSGRPCRHCGALIRSAPLGSPPRRLYWCPGCQAQ